MDTTEEEIVATEAEQAPVEMPAEETTPAEEEIPAESTDETAA